MKKALSLVCLITLFVATFVDAQDKPNFDAIENQARELAQKNRELREKMIELLKQQLEQLKHHSPESESVLAMQAILDLELSQDRVRSALSGAKIIAGDGTYLGRIGPTYDSGSIFCSYGKYGADYNTLSPFCSYSGNPPKIVLGETNVASLTVNGFAFPVAISPHTLKAIFADE